MSDITKRGFSPGAVQQTEDVIYPKSDGPSVRRPRTLSHSHTTARKCALPALDSSAASEALQSDLQKVHQNEKRSLSETLDRQQTSDKSGNDQRIMSSRMSSAGDWNAR